MMCEEGEFCLSLAQPMVQMSIHDLGPALFNREGDYTSGQHCKDLAYVMCKRQGFATYRYQCVWAHEPDPSDPLAVYRHGSNMAMVDPALPKLPKKPLLGMFRRVHMVTTLHIADAGNQKFNDSDEYITVDSGNAAWKDAIQNGVMVLKFKWEDIQKHREKFIALMASDNADSDIQMSDDELSISYRLMLEAEIQRTVPVGKTLANIQIDAVRSRAATQMPVQEYRDLLAWVNTTNKACMAWIRMWQRFCCSPKTFFVPTEFFLMLSGTPADCQCCRLCLLSWEFGADRTKECDKVNGKHRSRAVQKPQVESFKSMPVQLRESLEKKLRSLMTTYWDNRPDDAKVDALLAHFGLMLKRIGKKIGKAKTILEENPDHDNFMQQIARLEWEMRKGLSDEVGKGGSIGFRNLPEPVMPEPPVEDSGDKNSKGAQKKIQDPRAPANGSLREIFHIIIGV